MRLRFNLCDMICIVSPKNQGIKIKKKKVDAIIRGPTET